MGSNPRFLFLRKEKNQPKISDSQIYRKMDIRWLDKGNGEYSKALNEAPEFIKLIQEESYVWYGKKSPVPYGARAKKSIDDLWHIHILIKN